MEVIPYSGNPLRMEWSVEAVPPNRIRECADRDREVA